MRSITASVLLFLLSAVAVLGAEECEVCVKVMEDIRATLTKENARKKPAIEAAMGDYCPLETLGSREKKICYYIDPIKR